MDGLACLTDDEFSQTILDAYQELTQQTMYVGWVFVPGTVHNI